jgi:hydrogenase-4 component B
MTLLLLALACLLGGALLALPAARNSRVATQIGVSGSLLGSALGCAAALRVLTGAAAPLWSTPWQVPAGSFALNLDPLAACFVLPIALLGGICALYGAGYLAEEGRHRSLAPHWFFYNLLVAAMLLVVVAANAVLFLAAWELMTIASFFLVAWDHRREEARRAAWLYLIAAHCGLMLLLTLFLRAGVLCGSFDFAAFAPLAQLPAASASGLFLLGLFGFGVKAGLVPLHIWLPDAHPAAPSHVSALMSGVLVKTGIYGILRLLTLLPPAPAWWGWLVAGLGMFGALYAIALACLQLDIKRCLAYSTIENLGIILFAIGFSLVARAGGHPAIALLALAGGLLHIWNHALFKGLMFLGAGSLVHATGTRDMNRLGGLLRRMPLTGLLWIGGGLAISALPPLNGLVSEWLIYLGLLEAGTAWSGFSALPPLLLIGLLATVGALALVTFTRLLGISLLGEPRDLCARQAHEVSLTMLLPMGLLLTGCLAAGLLPQQLIRLLQRPLTQLLGPSAAAGLPVPLASVGTWSGILLAGLLVAALLLHFLRRIRPRAIAATWGCGYRFPDPHMAYTGGGFSELAFRQVLPKALRPEVTGGTITGLFPTPGQLQQISLDPVLTRQWRPLFAWLADRCQHLHWLQLGKLPIYLLYMFATSTLLLVWSLWTGKGG